MPHPDPTYYPVARGGSGRTELWPLLTADEIRQVYEVSTRHRDLVREAWQYVRRRVMLAELVHDTEFQMKDQSRQAALKDPSLRRDILEAAQKQRDPA